MKEIKTILLIVTGGLAVGGAVTSTVLYAKNKKLKHDLEITIAVGEVVTEQLEDYIHRYEFLKKQLDLKSNKKGSKK